MRKLMSPVLNRSTGMALLNAGKLSGATLVQSPSSKTYAAYYCPDLINAPFGTSGH